MKTFLLFLVAALTAFYPSASFSYEIDTANDPSIIFGDSPYIKNGYELQRRAPIEGKSEVTPWSASYWPAHMGYLSWRYQDPTFGKKWNKNFETLVEGMPLFPLLTKPSADNWVTASPAEKYDRLIADGAFAFTKENWDTTKSESSLWGTVPEWVGICHGWAPASIEAPRPVHPVTLTGADGKTKVTFLPDDIKALVSVLYARIDSKVRFLGRRCTTKMVLPGRVLGSVNPACMDVNAGAWHTVVLNLMGLQKKSFVLDVDDTKEVWNQPAASYSISFFNPNTDKHPTVSFNRSLVAIKDLKMRKSSRAGQTKYVFGVRMKLKYSSENGPHASLKYQDIIMTKEYKYDVELDSVGNIVGGEWYFDEKGLSDANPDFLWIPEPGTEPKTEEDLLLTESWDSRLPLPESWAGHAATASSKGVPLYGIVKELLRKSRLKDGETFTPDVEGFIGPEFTRP